MRKKEKERDDRRGHRTGGLAGSAPQPPLLPSSAASCENGAHRSHAFHSTRKSAFPGPERVSPENPVGPRSNVVHRTSSFFQTVWSDFCVFALTFKDLVRLIGFPSVDLLWGPQ